jgi:hypothetical protein
VGGGQGGQAVDTRRAARSVVEEDDERATAAVVPERGRPPVRVAKLQTGQQHTRVGASEIRYGCAGQLMHQFAPGALNCGAPSSVGGRALVGHSTCAP